MYEYLLLFIKLEENRDRNIDRHCIMGIWHEFHHNEIGFVNKINLSFENTCIFYNVAMVIAI